MLVAHQVRAKDVETAARRDYLGREYLGTKNRMDLELAKAKKVVAHRAVDDFVHDDMKIGMGTGE